MWPCVQPLLYRFLKFRCFRLLKYTYIKTHGSALPTTTRVLPDWSDGVCCISVWA